MTTSGDVDTLDVRDDDHDYKLARFAKTWNQSSSELTKLMCNTILTLSQLHS